MSDVILSLGFGLVTASILAMGAVGFTLQFGVTNLFNLAFGEVMTISMFASFLVHIDGGYNMWVAMAAGGLMGMIASFVMARLLYMPFINRGTPRSVMVIVTVAAAIIIKNVAQIFSGADFYSLALPPQDPVHILGMVFTPRQLAVMALSAACMLGLHLLFKYTRLGKAMRATSDDPELARSCGVPTTRIISAAWLLSGLLAGFAGVALAMTLGTFDTNTGSSFLLVVVAAAVFGSVGEPYGAMVGALVLGVVSELAALVNPDLKSVAAFTILVIVLLVRPAGLRGGRVMTAGEMAA